jgi:hypothetical protein
LEALRRAGGIGIGVLSLPVYAAIVMSSHQSSAVLALIGLTAWAVLALRHPEVGAKRQITGFVVSGITGLLIGSYLSIVTGQVSTIAEAPARYQSILYQPQLWESAWIAFKEHWFTWCRYERFWYLCCGAGTVPRDRGVRDVAPTSYVARNHGRNGCCRGY